MVSQRPLRKRTFIVVMFLFILEPRVECGVLALSSPNDQGAGRFGKSVSGIPDLTGDGRDDVVVGAWGEELGDEFPSSHGLVYIFDGATGDLLKTLISPNRQQNGRFGASVSGIPDTNGDGYGDVIVGTQSEETAGSVENSGLAYIFDGYTGALLHQLVSPVTLTEDFGGFGRVVAGIPDINDDGRGDVILRSGGELPDGPGAAHVYDGSSGSLIRTLVSPNPQRGGIFGESISSIPDVNGDGTSDIVIGAPGEEMGLPNLMLRSGMAYVFDGSSGELLHTLMSLNPDGPGHFGYSVGGVPDVNGDGRGDVVVGAFEDPPPTFDGRVYIFDGFTGERLRIISSPLGGHSGSFGDKVAGLEDVNGDGKGDVLVGALLASESVGFERPGRGYIFDGSNGNLLHTFVSPNQRSHGRFAESLASIPDTNGDGKPEVIFGTTIEHPGDSPDGAGRAYIFYSPFDDMSGCTSPNLVEDNFVNVKDLITVKELWTRRKEVSQSDFNLDGLVDGLDLYVFQDSWYEITSP